MEKIGVTITQFEPFSTASLFPIVFLLVYLKVQVDFCVQQGSKIIIRTVFLLES